MKFLLCSRLSMGMKGMMVVEKEEGTYVEVAVLPTGDGS